MAKFTWLGDGDPEAQVITQGGYSFAKGEPVSVKDADKGKFENNPLFSSEPDAKPVEADEPAPVDPDEGTEKAAVKAELRRLGAEVPRGNVTLPTLRAALAKALAH